MTQVGTTAARELLDRALGDPSTTVADATLLLDAGDCTPADRAVLLRARGLAHRLLGDLHTSEQDLNAGVDLARSAGLRTAELGLLLTLAGTYVFQGDTARALSLLEECVADARGELKAEALFQLGTTYAQAGDLDTAIEIYGQALPRIRRHGRQDWASNLLGNRGIMHFHRGDYAASIRDLDQAIALQVELGIPAQAAINKLNKAQALFMSGEVAASLALYREAESMQDALGMPLLMHAQKCETYLAAGLFEDCLELARLSHGFSRDGQATIGAIRSLMPGAEAALALRRPALAVELADAVHRVPGADGFPVWLARADLARLEAHLQQGDTTAADVDTALALRDRAVGGDASTAARAQVVAADIALQVGLVTRGLDLLEDAAHRVRRCPLHVQMYRWGVLAVARATAGNQRGALSAVRAGLRVFDRLLAGVTSFDVRARASRYAEVLTEVGVRALIERGSLDDVVTLIERVRSSPIHGPRPPKTKAPTLAADESMVSWVEVDHELLCIHRTAEATALQSCGSIESVAARVDEQGFVYRQLARRGRLSGEAGADLHQRRDDVDHALDRTLLPPGLRDRVVLSPSPSIMGLCWGSLPALSIRPHVIASSLALARRPVGKPLKRAHVLGSTDLAHIGDELLRVAGYYGSRPNEMPTSTTPSSWPGVDVLHLAGHFVSDGSDPLLSGVALDTWTFRGLELPELRKSPRVVVLSACASSTAEKVGHASIGFATAALAAGSACVVATQTLIEDGDEIVQAMSDLHELLASGVRPAVALCTLRTNESDSSQAVRSLIALGAGW